MFEQRPLHFSCIVSLATKIQKPNCLHSNTATIIPWPQLIVDPVSRSAIMKTPFCCQGSSVVARQRNRLSREATSCAKSTFVATVISVTKCLYRVLARPNGGLALIVARKTIVKEAINIHWWININIVSAEWRFVQARYCYI